MSVADFFDKNMLNKYNTTGPRYTSYPTAVAFNSEFNEADFEASIARVNSDDDAPFDRIYRDLGPIWPVLYKNLYCINF